MMPRTVQDGPPVKIPGSSDSPLLWLKIILFSLGFTFLRYWPGVNFPNQIYEKKKKRINLKPQFK